MKRLNWSVDLSAAKTAAENAVNEYFNNEAFRSIQKDQEHKAKREIAIAVLNDPSFVPPQPFLEEAAASGLTDFDLAKQISEKPDNVMARGALRRADIIAIRRATTPTEIDAVLMKYTVDSSNTGI